MYILNVINYFGRIVDKYVDFYVIFNVEINEYFEDFSNKTIVEKVEKFGLYGLVEKIFFYR